jgi:hypothetical protein
MSALLSVPRGLFFIASGVDSDFEDARPKKVHFKILKMVSRRSEINKSSILLSAKNEALRQALRRFAIGYSCKY